MKLLLGESLFAAQLKDLCAAGFMALTQKSSSDNESLVAESEHNHCPLITNQKTLKGRGCNRKVYSILSDIKTQFYVEVLIIF